MKKESINVYIVDPYEETNTREMVKRATIANNWREFAGVIGCNAIDIMEESCGGITFNIIYDDEFMLNGNNRPSVITADGHPIIGGKIICAGMAYDEESGAYEDDLTPEQQHAIFTAAKVGVYQDDSETEYHHALLMIDAVAEGGGND